MPIPVVLRDVDVLRVSGRDLALDQAGTPPTERPLIRRPPSEDGVSTRKRPERRRGERRLLSAVRDGDRKEHFLVGVNRRNPAGIITDDLEVERLDLLLSAKPGDLVV